VPVGNESDWYRALAKPGATPPGWVFPVVWSSLYVMMGLALAMILNARGAGARGLGITLFVAQFALNLAWTPLFFGAHRIALALLVIVAMTALTIATAFAFARVRKAAAWLLVPYMVWISFASVLTWRIGQLNPHAETLVPAPQTTQML
jgi:benzodiazapine receptor